MTQDQDEVDILILPENRDEDDFGQPIDWLPGEVLYVAPTMHGPIGIMTEASWRYHGRYRKLQEEGGQGARYQWNTFNWVRVAA